MAGINSSKTNSCEPQKEKSPSVEGQWDRPPASLLASTPEPPQHRHLYPPHRHHHHSTTIPHRLRRFATSPLTCLRSASYHSSPSRITSSSSAFFTLTQPPLLKLHLPPPPLHRRRAPPSEAAPSQILSLRFSSLVFHNALAKCSLFHSRCLSPFRCSSLTKSGCYCSSLVLIARTRARVLLSHMHLRSQYTALTVHVS